MGKIAIIGGTGVYDPSILNDRKEVRQETPYGTITAVEGEYHGRTVHFMNRHGEGHSIPPHMINYRANIRGLKELGVDRVLATAAVGCLWCRTTDYFSSLGLMIGFFAAALFEERYVRFANTRCVPRMILRVLVGCGLFLGLNTLLKLPFDPAFLASATAGSFAVRTVRYAISSFCVMGLYPLCFRLFDPLWHKLCPHAKHTPAQSGATDTAGQKDSEKTDPGAADDTPTAPV